MKQPFNRGQILIPALLLMTIALISIPALITYIQNEAIWSVKAQRTTNAFQLAEGAVERGYLKLLSSSSTFRSLAAGGSAPAGFNLDQVYTDSSGGTYEIKLAQDSTTSVSITGVGRDRDRKEVRSIKAVYASAGSANSTITALGTITVGAAVQVQWGPSVSFTSIATGGRNFPRFYSTGNVTTQDANGATPPNTDNVQWWSYQSTLEQPPDVDFNFYRSSAIASGTSADSDCGTYYKTAASFQFKGCNDTTGRTFYTTGSFDFAPGSGGNYIVGSVIALGDISFNGNGGGNGTYAAKIPSTAWKDYCKNSTTWSTYQAFDTGEPATCAAATASNYTTTQSYTLSGVTVHGFLYGQNNLSFTGGGNGIVHGVVRLGGNAVINTSNFEFFYDDAVARDVRTTSINLSRSSWQEITCGWSSTHATCP